MKPTLIKEHQPAPKSTHCHNHTTKGANHRKAGAPADEPRPAPTNNRLPSQAEDQRHHAAEQKPVGRSLDSGLLEGYSIYLSLS